MAHAQDVKKASTKKKKTEVVDERPLKIELEQSPAMTLEASKIPVRTIIYAEVGDMDQPQIALMVKKIGEVYSANNNPHYIIPVRHGRISSDAIFETEILDMINKICEIKDNKICLRNGVTEVNVIRQKV